MYGRIQTAREFFFFLLFMEVESWQGEGIWRKKKNSSNLERITSFTPSRPQTVSGTLKGLLGGESRDIQNPIPNIPINLKQKRCQSTSLELRVKIRSKFSTNSLKVDSSMGLYCRHSRISKYLHRNRHQKEKKKKKNVKLICPRLIWKKRLTLWANNWLVSPNDGRREGAGRVLGTER